MAFSDIYGISFLLYSAEATACKHSIKQEKGKGKQEFDNHKPGGKVSEA